MRLTFLQPDPYTTPYTPTYDPNPSVWHHMGDALSQSANRVAALISSILPGLIVFIVALGLMTALGALLSYILRRILTAARFDERLGRQDSSHIADFSPAHSPTALAGRIVFWVCVLLGLLMGVSALDVSYATGTGPSMSLLPYLTHAVGAILILFLGTLIARYLARTVLIGAVNSQLQYARFLSLGVKWLVLVLTAAMALDHLQIGGTVVELAFGILFGGIVLTLSLAIGLGSRDLVTRSLERNMDRTADRTPAEIPYPPPPTAARETLRHF